MRIELGTLSVLSLVLLMAVPVHADVNSVEINKEHFGIKDNFTISGTITDANRVTLLASMKGPDGEKLTRTTMSDHDAPIFTFVPVRAEELFDSRGVYTVNVFTENQRPEDGTKIKLEYMNSRIILLPDFILELNKIGNKTTNAGQNFSFSARVSDTTINSEKFSLENNPPAGATINPDTGRFSWTPGTNQTGSYIFDVVVNAGPLEDRETIQILVYQARDAEQVPETEKEMEPAVQESPGILASFVDPTKDPQHYIDRYNGEPAYREWFDANYPEYSSIHQAVGLEAPPDIPASFVDPTKDPQHYIDRYNGEPAYREWFDANYPEYSSIHQAVGISEVEESQKEFGYCGKGTKLVDGICTVVETPKQKSWWQFW